MKCPNCGRENTGRFCVSCGTRLTSAPAAQTPAEGTNPRPSAPWPGSDRENTPGYVPNRNVAPDSNQSYGQNANRDPRSAPSQNPYYGSSQNQSYTPNQGYNGGFAYNQNPGYVPQQGYNPGPQAAGGYQNPLAGALGQSPGAQLLRKLSGSPLMLFSAILVTLYAGVMCYICGKSLINWFDGIGDLFKYATDYVKVSTIVNIVGCAVHLVMAVWLVIAAWAVFGSGGSVGSLGCSKAYCRFRLFVFALLTVSALITLVAVLAKENISDSTFLFAATQLTTSGNTHVGFRAAIDLFRDETVLVIFFCVLFILGAAQSSLLSTALNSSGRMVRYGGPLQKRVVPAAVLTLFFGLLLMAANIYLLVEYGRGLDNILFYSACIALGLASFFYAIVLFMDAGGVKRMQQGN